MDGKWSSEIGTHEINAYADWEELIDEREPDPASFFPVFVELRKSANSKFTPAIDKLDKLISEGRLLIESNDLRYLELIRKIEITAIYFEDRVYCFLYVKKEMINETHLFVVQHVSPSVRIKNFNFGFRDFPELQIIQDVVEPGEPIIASIDDGIGFLNSRFCKQSDDGADNNGFVSTRYQSIWLQSIENNEQPGLVPADNPMQIGEVLSRSKINKLLGTGSEAANYSLIQNSLFEQEPDAHRSLDFSSTHGTAIMDCAAGAEPGELDEIELLGVQLPPHSIRDSFGKRFDGYVLQGLRWIMDRAIDLAVERTKVAKNAVSVPLVVNISLGSTAGPKDGTGFLEKQIEREIERYKLLAKSKMIVVFSYGNNLRTNQVAYFTLPKSAHSGSSAETLDWCILPDDKTASYLEIRAENCDSSNEKSGRLGVRFSVQPPGGDQSPIDWPEPLAHSDLKTEDDARVKEITIARIYGEEMEQGGARKSAVVAVRPTRSLQGEQVAPAGAWRIRFENASHKDLKISVQVQRDDTPGSYRPHGRQSYLDHSKAHGWDSDTLDYSKPINVCPITREGTHTAQTSWKLPEIRKVGAVYRRKYGSNPTGDIVTLYSSAGATEKFLSYSEGPTDMAISDESRLLPGIIASGTISGSSTRISGTSIAAAKVTREWLDHFHKIVLSAKA